MSQSEQLQLAERDTEQNELSVDDEFDPRAEAEERDLPNLREYLLLPGVPLS